MREIDKTLPKDQRILLAAEEVFSRRGYVQATLDEIIALADTGKGTVYKYFGNKDNLFYTLVASKIEPFLQCLQEVVASGKSTSEKIRSYMLALLPFLRDNKDLYRILWYEVSGNQRGFHPVFLNDSEGMETGFMKQGQPTITAHHLFGGVTMSVLHYVGQPEFTDAELADLIVDRFLYGHAVR